MRILDTICDKQELSQMSTEFGADFLKAVVDVVLEKIAIDAELHSDLESMMLDAGSSQENLWGINFYPREDADLFIEFDSLINIRPKQNNRARTIQDPEVERKIVSVVNKWIK